jgi:hypothetical protein
VFERFTEHARRSISFALEEARGLGSKRIDTVHLLLGILREDPAVAAQVGTSAADTIRKELELVAPQKRERIVSTGDLPLSEKARRALRYAIDEADALADQHLHTPHLILGLLRIEECTAAKLLRAYGLEQHRYRETLGVAPVESAAHPEPALSRDTSLEPAIYDLKQLVDDTLPRLQGRQVEYGEQRLPDAQWTRKEALGHLIDWAIAHERWVTQALMEPKLQVDGYPNEDAVRIQHYADFPWTDAVALWASLNRLLIHVLQRVPADKLGVPCRIGVANPVPLVKLIEAYVEHCRDSVAQIEHNGS